MHGLHGTEGTITLLRTSAQTPARLLKCPELSLDLALPQWLLARSSFFWGYLLYVNESNFLKLKQTWEVYHLSWPAM